MAIQVFRHIGLKLLSFALALLLWLLVTMAPMLLLVNRLRLTRTTL